MDKKEKILIVDDEKIVRESLYHWFEDDNYLVDTAEDGETALKKYEKEKYDLLLVDMKMPGMSGLDLLSKIKAIDKDALHYPYHCFCFSSNCNYSFEKWRV